MNKHIDATPTEAATLAEAITEASAAKLESQKADRQVTRIFTVFCEAHGIPGATFAGIQDGKVLVTLPEQKPALVDDAA